MVLRPVRAEVVARGHGHTRIVEEASREQAQSFTWDETPWVWNKGYGKQTKPGWRAVVVDFGVKRNILRLLAEGPQQGIHLVLCCSALSLLCQVIDKRSDLACFGHRATASSTLARALSGGVSSRM